MQLIYILASFILGCIVGWFVTKEVIKVALKELQKDYYLMKKGSK